MKLIGEFLHVAISHKQKNVQGLPAMTDLIDDRELKELSENTAVLRVWLPEAARTALGKFIRQQ